MTVYIALHTWDTPDNEGSEILGVYSSGKSNKKSPAQRDKCHCAGRYIGVEKTKKTGGYIQ